MNVCVTGGAGFIGSNLVDLLVAQGHQVVVVDDLRTGRRGNLPPGVPFYECSVGAPRVREVLEEHRIEVVCHHAAQIDVRKSIEDPVYDAGVNIVDGLRLLDACRSAKVRKLVYASTGGAIYGDPGVEALPANESTPVRPLSGYGISKHTLEHYLELYRSLYGLGYTVLRYANIYGPRQDPLGEAGVIAIFTDCLLSGKTPRIFGDGKQTRDYVYVGDVCRANLLALTAGDGEMVNIGTAVETSVIDLLDELNRATGQSVEAKFEPARAGEVYRIALDPARAEQVLGWRPEVNLAEGLRKTIEFQRRLAQA
ncbi:MAG: NAD-dependent epimerase/dehydratase family protein [Candidatus Eremiobacteraeota bacterium]|nr:NAD-dependent epimerase/dehydratase family protein [Candidatus Eremiobacteraeota bacterium]